MPLQEMFLNLNDASRIDSKNVIIMLLRNYNEIRQYFCNQLDRNFLKIV